MTSRKIALGALLSASLLLSAHAREQIKIAGSSTVYPFSSYVAEEFSATSGFKTPIVESIGTGGGFKLFCSGLGSATSDIANASRPMKASEFENCLSNGVTDITGIMIGYDGISLAQSQKSGALELTKEQLFLALAEEVPMNGKLIKNPYKRWSEIDSSLPHRPIIVYGPPSTSGTRDAFEELVMQSASKKFDLYGESKGKYKKIRQDSAYIPAGENDNLIVQKLAQEPNALGIFGYSFLEENPDKVQGITIDGVYPTAESIGAGSYPISRSLYIYVKNAHRTKVKGLEEFIQLYASDKMIGKEGILRNIGLIPMQEALLIKAREQLKTPLTLEMVKANRVHF